MASGGVFDIVGGVLNDLCQFLLRLTSDILVTVTEGILPSMDRSWVEVKFEKVRGTVQNTNSTVHSSGGGAENAGMYGRKLYRSLGFQLPIGRKRSCMGKAVQRRLSQIAAGFDFEHCPIGIRPSTTPTEPEVIRDIPFSHV